MILSTLFLLRSAAMIISFCTLGVSGAQIVSYENAMVVELPDWYPASFQCDNMLFVWDSRSRQVVDHEYGHYLQQMRGLKEYWKEVAIPSEIGGLLYLLHVPIADYKSFPWEAEATQLGKEFRNGT